jgi:hypothetical protein
MGPEKTQSSKQQRQLVWKTKLYASLDFAETKKIGKKTSLLKLPKNK